MQHLITIACDMRAEVRARRRQLGLSLERLGAMLSLHRDSIRRAEASSRYRVNPRTFLRLQKFIGGAYDCQLYAELLRQDDKKYFRQAALNFMASCRFLEEFPQARLRWLHRCEECLRGMQQTESS